MTRRRTVRAEELLGRRVRGADGRIAGRIEEIRVDRRGESYEVTEYLIGTGALLERLAMARTWMRRRPQTLIARWDQIDISTPAAPRLLCSLEELQHG